MNRIPMNTYHLGSIKKFSIAKTKLDEKSRKDVTLKIIIPKPYTPPNFETLEKALKSECGKHLYDLDFKLIHSEKEQDTAKITFNIPKSSELSDFYQIEETLEEVFKCSINLFEQSVEYFDDDRTPQMPEDQNRLKACGISTLFSLKQFEEDFFNAGYKNDIFTWWNYYRQTGDESHFLN